MHGAAVFAHGDDIFTPVPLWRSVPGLTRAGRRFVLRPAAARASRTNDVLLVEAGRELGRVIAFDHGHVVDVADADGHIANRHHQAGWMQSRIQHDIDRQAELHLAEVVAIVERLHDALGRPPIVIAATEEHAASVRRQITGQTAGAVIGVLGNARDMDATRLYDEVRRLADEHDAGREEALLERRAEQLGRDGSRPPRPGRGRRPRGNRALLMEVDG